MQVLLNPRLQKVRWLLGVFCLFALFTCHAKAEAAVEGSIEGTRGCTVDYQIHEPESPTMAPTIILAHGFMRDLSTMTGWGSELSGMGFRVVLVSLCNSSWFGGRHEANTLDLVAVRQHLEENAVIYAGFSAGGLSAYLAALSDEAAAGFIGLDAVDSGSLAWNSVDQLQVPGLFITAPASICNAGGNFDQVIAKLTNVDLHAVAAATHCSFERPYDKRCSLICGRLTDEESAAAQADILSTVSGWLTKFGEVRPANH